MENTKEMRPFKYKRTNAHRNSQRLRHYAQGLYQAAPDGVLDPLWNLKIHFHFGKFYLPTSIIISLQGGDFRFIKHILVLTSTLHESFPVQSTEACLWL